MAYGGVISLKRTIQCLLDSSIFSLNSSTRENLGSAYTKATSLQKVLQRSLDSPDEEIREAVHKLEDFLELHQSDVYDLDENLLLDSEQVTQEVRRFASTAERLREDYVAESDNRCIQEEEEEDDDDDDIVGYSDEFRKMTSHLSEPVRPDDFAIFPIVGRPGTGRSYVGMRLFDDVGNDQRELGFDCGVWVTVGGVHKQVILQRILAQIFMIERGGGDDGREIMVEGDEEMAKHCLYSRLLGRRYMIVLDDVCDTEVLDYLFPWFPMQNNGSLVLLTTAAMDVARHANPHSIFTFEDINTNYEDVWWDILRRLLLRVWPASPEMEEAGRKIVRNCGGLYVCYVKAILFLCKAERTPEAWNQIADRQHHPVFQIVDEILETAQIEEDFANLTVEPASDKDFLSPFIEDLAVCIDFDLIKKMLFPERFLPKMEVISFVGMAGIGKTTFVEKIFEYTQQNLHQFDPFIGVWVTLGPKYQSEDILTDILAQTFPAITKMEIKRDAGLANDLIGQLSNTRFLIVLDDVWDEAPLLNLANLFPNIKGRALLTTRLEKLAHSEKIDVVHEMRLLNKEESWDLLRQKVFDEGLCPHELEKSGKKIAENCDGLPLTIITVANLLSKAEKTPQYWNNVANKNSDFKNALEKLSNTLLPSYKSLPHHLKSCFLYMGVFPENYEVSTPQVLKLWIAEGFLEPDSSQGVEDFAAQCLSELVDTSLVMVCHKGSKHGVKTCRLNSVLWYLSNGEAVKSKFFHAVSVHDLTEGIKNQRRFCIRNCILLRIKTIHDSMMKSISTARSLLCTGPYHPYPLPVCFELRLLRVLDTLAIRFYDFPIEVVKLIHLRHLALTCNGKIPASISKLWNLQFLIVRQHLRIKSFGDCWYLPMEIWDMKELRHLQISGSMLPTPTCGSILPNLETLIEVSPQSCSGEVLRGIPNLKKLGIQIELAPDGDDKPFHYLNHISNLSKLKSLKCVVVNPEDGFEVVTPPAPISVFPPSLEKLNLSGLGYPWEYMNIIGKLENLEVLKLGCYAFQGHEWETGDYAFEKLRHLSIEDADLVRWKTSIYSFRKLKHLSIKHCYNLEQLPSFVVGCEMIEVVDCNHFVVNWVKQMEERRGYRRLLTQSDLKTHVESSWDVGK